MLALLLTTLASAASPAEPEPATPESPPAEPEPPGEREDPPKSVPAPILIPPGTTPPGESAGPEIPDDDDDEPEPFPATTYREPEPEPEVEQPEFYEFEERRFEDMPYAATAARKSAVQRNNDVLVRPFNKPVYSIAAAGRFATSLIGGREVIQPFGFGVGAQLRIHFLRVFRSRFGVEVYAGYTRFPERVEYAAVEGVSSEITRLNLLAHTDVSAGPSLQIPIGPVFLQFGASAGVAFSTLSRTQSVEAIEDEVLFSTDALIRGGLSLGVPIYARHGLTLGGAVQHVFSRDEVAINLSDPDGPTAQPFATWLEINLGYQMWF
ncbi:MAG: hypothetical protein R6X02_33210 [Enhygromyxa sp.]